MTEKKNPDKEIQLPEHVPPVPYDTKRDKEKERLRKLAEELKKTATKKEPIIVFDDGTAKKSSELTLDEQKIEFVRCALSPIYFIENYLWIFDQTKNDGMGEIVPFLLFDFQKDLINEYQANRFVIANKYRQAGISTTTCAYIAWYVMFNRNRSVAIVADKLDTARDELMNDVVEFIEGCPEYLKPKTGKEAAKSGLGTFKDTQRLKRYDNGSSLGAFSSKGLRGYTPTLLFWDETAWTEKGDKFWTAARPTLQTGGNAIMVSTPSGLDAVFYKTFDSARRKENNFKAVELWWFNDPRYNKDLVWIKNKEKDNEIRMVDEGWDNKHRIKLMDDGWEAWSPWFGEQVADANGDMRKIAQELLCSFLGSGDNFVAEEYLKRIEEHEIERSIRQEYADLKMWIFEDPEPGEEYLMAIDVSSGHGDDYSTINLLKTVEFIENKIIKKGGVEKKIRVKKSKVEQVAEYYGKLTPQQLAYVANTYGIKYNNAYAVVDVTGGYGVQTVEKLIELGYENIHYSEITHKPTRDRLQGYIKDGQKTLPDGTVIAVDLIPGFFIGGNRGSVLLEMQRAIHLEDVIIKSQRLLSELKTFITVPGNRVADHKRSFHDDSIMGLAIGLYTLNFEMTRYKQNKGITEKMINAMLTSADLKDKQDKDKNNKYKSKHQPIRVSPESALGQHMANDWLFSGIKDKRKK